MTKDREKIIGGEGEGWKWSVERVADGRVEGAGG